MNSSRLARRSIAASVFVFTFASPILGDGKRTAPATADLYGDPLPPGVTARLGTIRFRPGPWAKTTAILPDGKTLITTFNHDSVCFWDLASGKPTRVFHVGGGDPKFALAPDAKTLAVGGFDGIDVYGVTDGKHIRHLNAGRINSLTFTPDGIHVISGGELHDGSIRVWNVQPGDEIRRIRLQEAGVGHLLVAPDNRTLVSVGDQIGATHIIDLVSGEEMAVIGRDSFEMVFAAALSPDGKALLLGGSTSRHDNGAVCLFDVPTGRHLRSFPLDRIFVDGLALTPDGNTLVASDYAGTMAVWELATGKELRRWQGARGVRVVTPDGKTVIGHGKGGGMHLWDIDTGKPLQERDGHGGQITAIAFSPDGKWLASSSWNEGAALLWDLTTGKQKHVLPKHSAKDPHVTGVAFLRDGSGVLSSGSDHVIPVCDPTTAKELRRFTLRNGDQVRKMTLSADGKHLVCSSNAGLTVFDVATGKELVFQNQASNSRVPGQSAFGSDGKRYIKQAKKDLELCDIDSGKVLATLRTPDSFITHLGYAFSPDGTLFAVRTGTQGQNYLVRIFDTATGKEKTAFPAELFGASITFSPDGKSLAVGGRTVFKIHNTSNGKELWSSSPTGAHMAVLEYSPDGRTVATGLYDGSILLWDVTKPIPGYAAAKD
jgi:WD40 repeat protein